MRIVGAGVLAAVVAACELVPIPVDSRPPAPGVATAAKELGQARLLWAGQGIGTYRLKVAYICECPGGAYELSIRDGALIQAVLDGETVELSSIEGFPTTVDAIFRQADAALRRGGSIQAAYDPQTGVPLKMFIDPVPNAIDDELGIEISSFEPG